MHLILHAGRLLDDVVRASLAEHGLHQGQARVLDALLEFGPQAVSQLARELQIAQPTATVMLKRMEAAGLVSKRTVPGDARVVLLALTPAGRKAAGHTRETWKRVQLALNQLVPTEIREHLKTGLSAVRDGLGGRAPTFSATDQKDDKESK